VAAFKVVPSRGADDEDGGGRGGDGDNINNVNARANHDDAFQGEKTTAIMQTPHARAMTRRVRWRRRGQPTPNGRGRGGGRHDNGGRMTMTTRRRRRRRRRTKTKYNNQTVHMRGRRMAVVATDDRRQRDGPWTTMTTREKNYTQQSNRAWERGREETVATTAWTVEFGR